VPIGWTAAFAASTLSISPGANATTTLAVISPVSALDGFYTIGVTATNSAATTYSASTSATYVIVSSLSVTVSTDQSSYTRPQTVSITAIVAARGSAVSGASVTFTITKSDSTVVTGTVSTGADGSAVFKYRLKKQDPIGIYQAKAATSLNGISGSGAASFTVQ
jgi:hypothetical protein